MDFIVGRRRLPDVRWKPRLGSPQAALPLVNKTICSNWPLVRFPPTDSVLLSIMLLGTIVPCGELCLRLAIVRHHLAGSLSVQPTPLPHIVRVYSTNQPVRLCLNTPLHSVMSLLEARGDLGVRAFPSLLPPKKKEPYNRW